MVHKGILWTLAIILVISLVGCQSREPTAATGTGSTGDTEPAGGLGDVNALALGTLQLEGTADAVTAAQSEELLPLWRALAGSELQDSAERNAVLMQIEATMTAGQMASIAALQLTSEDMLSWVDSRRSEAGAVDPQRVEGPPQGLPAEGTAAMQAQPGRGGAAGSASYVLTEAVVELLAERSGGTIVEATILGTGPVAVEPLLVTETAAEAEPVEQLEPAAKIEAAEQVEPAPGKELDNTPEPTPVPEASETTVAEQMTYVVQAGDTLAAIARVYGVAVEAIAAANGLVDPNVIAVGQELTIPAQAPADTSTTSVALATGSARGTVQRLPGLEQIPDTDPGPPLTIEISANYAIQDPLVEKSRTYVVTGIVRNDGDETYAVSSLHVTFFDAEGFRGVFQKAPGRGQTGGEWIWHGQVEADLACLLLAPGEVCPFRVEITAQDMASFLIHADAVVTGRESAQVELSDVQVVDQGTGYLQITGTATNPNPFEIKNVTVSGVLTDEGGQIVSLGSTYVLQQDIEPGALVRFDVRIGKTSYVGYQLYAQAERDWE